MTTGCYVCGGTACHCEAAYELGKEDFKKTYSKTLSVIRGEKLELKQKIRTLEAELNELNSDKYFIDGERITKDHLKEKEKAPKDEILEARDQAFAEIGRLRRFIERVAKFHFPVKYSWNEVQEWAQKVLNGEEYTDGA